jgi:hypothetical protein
MSDISTNTFKMLYNVPVKFDGKNLYAPGNPEAEGEDINVLALDMDGDGAFDMNKDLILAADSNHDSVYTKDEFTSIATPEGLRKFAGTNGTLTTEDIKKMGLAYIADKNRDGRIETAPSRLRTFYWGFKNFVNKGPMNRNLTGIETINGLIGKYAKEFTKCNVEIDPSASEMKETTEVDRTARAATLRKQRSDTYLGMGINACGIALVAAAKVAGVAFVPIGLLMCGVGFRLLTR